MKRRFTLIVLALWAAVSLVQGATYSGTLPVLFINTEGGVAITSKEDYVQASYWLDPMGVEGVEAFGTSDEPLTLQIKGRGNYTWTGFDKKPYRLKLDAKAGLLGMKKSKHFGLLAHADDQFGWLKNTLGFELSKRLGLAWTPSQAPVEVVLNGDYIGLYMLTELVRIDKDRVNIVEQPDNITHPDSITGGWLVEIDNYDEPATDQIKITEPTGGRWGGETMRFTHKTPELLSSAQEQYLINLVSAANDAIYATDKSSTAWENYIDIDALARYYIVQEVMNNQESFHGSCYWHKEMGADTKMVFGPVWDFGNSFNNSNILIHTNPPFHQHWIGEIYKFPRFKAAVERIWQEFKGSEDYTSLDSFIDAFAAQISQAAVADAQRWPQYAHADMASQAAQFKSAKDAKVNFLVSQWGDAADPSITEGLSLAEGEQAVFFVKPDDWSGSVYAWIWRSGDASVNYTGGSWPGQQLTEVKSGVYKWTYTGTDEVAADALVIFSSNGNPQTDSSGFAYVNGGVYTSAGYTATVSEGGDTPEPTPDPTLPTECYLIGKVNGNEWAYDAGVAMTRTADGVFTADVNLVGNDYFAVATSLTATGWDDLAANYRYGPSEDGNTAEVGVASAMARNGHAWKVAEDGEFTVTVDFNALTLTVAAKSDEPDPQPDPDVPSQCYLIGQVNGNDWVYNQGVALTKTADGIFAGEVSFNSTPAYFGVATSLAATSWGDLNANYRYGAVDGNSDVVVGQALAMAKTDGGDATWKMSTSGTFTVTVNFNDLTITVAETGTQPDPDPITNDWTIYFDKPDDWTAPIYAYVYTIKDNRAVPVASWPGEETTLLSGSRYQYDFTLELGTETYVLFSDSRGVQTQGDPGFTFVNKAIYDYNGYKALMGLKGDINGDESVDGNDVSALLEMVLAGGVTDEQKAVADVNGDGSVDGNDVSALLEMVLAGE